VNLARGFGNVLAAVTVAALVVIVIVVLFVAVAVGVAVVVASDSLLKVITHED